MIKLLPLILFLSSCAAPLLPAEKTPEKEYFLARVTFYSDDPKYGKKTASGRIARHGTTVAAAKKVPFGTQYRIPRLKQWISTDGNFRVEDRGSAVDKRTASRGKLPVIDVYVKSPDYIRRLGGRSGNIFKVYKK